MNDTTNSPATRNTRRRPNRALIAVIGLIVVAAGWYGVNKFLDSGSDDGEYIYATVSTGDIEDLVTSTGTLQPRDFVDVGAQVSGQIERLYVEVGDEVKEGDLLVSIDATTSRARVDSNRASLRSSESGLQNQLNNLAKAERDYQRQQNLYKEDATTLEALLNAETALKSAQQQIVTSRAQIEQQKANMSIEESNLKFTSITAPITGTVMSIAVKQGQTINATQTSPVLLRIANLGTMTVQSDVSEADVAKLYKGINVYFTTLGGQNRRWYGTLKRIEPTPKVTNSVVLYNALFDVDNEGGTLMPSMTAQVYFVSAEARGVLTVPMAALQQGQQIAREMAEKENPDGAEGRPAGFPGGMGGPSGPGGPGGPGAMGGPGGPGGPGNAAAGAPAAGSPEAAAVAATAGEPGAAPAGAPGATPGAESAAPGMRGGPGGFGGQRPGGFNGGQPPTAEQIEQFRRTRAAGGPPGGFGGQRPGGFGGMGMPGNGGGGARAPQQRRGTVMVKLADGTLEPRPVVIGVTNRVLGEVLEGLKAGEEVVVGRRDPAADAAAGAAAGAQPPGGQNQQGRPGGGFPGGGFPGGGGGRPF